MGNLSFQKSAFQHGYSYLRIKLS